MHVELYTWISSARQLGIVSRAEVADFKRIPEIVVWGERYFVWDGNDGFGSADGSISHPYMYIEACVVFIPNPIPTLTPA